MQKRVGLYIGVVLLGMATMAMAQKGHWERWWHSPEIIAELNLNSEEMQRLEDTFKKSRDNMIRQKNRVEAEQSKLQQLLEKRDLDEAAVTAQNGKLEEARTALANERTAFVLEVRKIIGYERFQRLVELRHRNKR